MAIPPNKGRWENVLKLAVQLIKYTAKLVLAISEALSEQG